MNRNYLNNSFQNLLQKLPVIYQYVYENIYDSDIIEYNKHAKKTWDYIKNNDEFNLISKINEKPSFYNLFNCEINSDNNIEYEIFSSDSESSNVVLTPYDIQNPYIEEDIYNKNNSFIVFSVNKLFELLDYENEEIILDKKEKKIVKKFLISILTCIKERKEFSSEIQEMFDNFTDKNIDCTSKEKKEIFEILNLFMDEKENPFNFIYDYIKEDF